jgi:hypothetical protein
MLVGLYVPPDEELVWVIIRSQDEDVRATVRAPVEPGGSYHGYTYEQLRALGSGAHDLIFPAPQEVEPPPAR